MEAITFQEADGERLQEQARALISEYLNWLNERLGPEYDMQFDVAAMLRSDLTDPDKFRPPHGRFYLARHAGQIAGVGCLKKLSAAVGELQRMYVLPAFRGKGIGRALAHRLIEDARLIGYRKLRLESLEFLEAAHALYRSIGFHEIEPYADNSMESYQPSDQLQRYYSITVFMEMDL